MADNTFNAEFGAGLAALNAGRLAEAREHLEKARQMRPDSTEVGAALQRAADTGSGRSLAELEQKAAKLAGEERWTEAQAIYDEPAFDRLPILADAVTDAGCDNADILTHCRGDGRHVRGCWVVDLLLGKD